MKTKRVKLTPPQVEELKRLVQAPQRHERRRVVRIQNSLRAKRLVRFMRNGKLFQPDVFEILTSNAGYIGVTCEITAAGREALAAWLPLAIEIVESATGKVEKKLGPYASERLRDKADDGVNRNLDHERFYTRFAR